MAAMVVAPKANRFERNNRNNWMFYGSDKGGRTGAVLSTLIATCKRLRIDPFAYLRDLFAHCRSSANPH